MSVPFSEALTAIDSQRWNCGVGVPLPNSLGGERPHSWSFSFTSGPSAAPAAKAEVQCRVPLGWVTALANQGSWLGWKGVQQSENLTC